MTERNKLDSLRIIAKRFAREARIPHHQALDLIAVRLNQPHWNALASAWKNGWQPSPAQMQTAEQMLPTANVSLDAFRKGMPSETGADLVEHGKIGIHEYWMAVDRFTGVVMRGRGWIIHVDEAPNDKPRMDMDQRYKDNPLSDPEFVAKALSVLNQGVEKLRALIAADWPRRSTKPDAEGRVTHPLRPDSELSSQWYCLHCDTELTSKQMVKNMWHCANCNATPVDIFASAFWRTAS